ncbi:MAG TPA: GatB/YqeY domain-containing protein [Rhodoblastus sp.]|nr:GatB/YqeY domain-containing protein [Rhodoblastus sp.]
MLREQFTAELKLAMKAGNKRRVDTIRMITAALKDKDIEARGAGKEVGEDDILALLQKLVKSRQESMEIYEQNARPELAAQEREEIAVITSFLPQPMNEEEVAAAIKAAIAELGATSIKDMGKVIADLKAKHAGKMDFAKVSGQVKAALAG